MKFRMKLSIVIYAFAGTIIAITAASLVLNILILAGARGFQGGSVPVTSVSLVCSLIFAALCLAVLFNTSYSFKEEELRIWFGVFYLSVPYNQIMAVAVEKLTKQVFLQYASKSKNKEYEILSINIAPMHNESFIDEIIKKNPSVKHIVNDDIDDDNPENT